MPTEWDPAPVLRMETPLCVPSSASTQPGPSERRLLGACGRKQRGTHPGRAVGPVPVCLARRQLPGAPQGGEDGGCRVLRPVGERVQGAGPPGAGAGAAVCTDSSPAPSIFGPEVKPQAGSAAPGSEPPSQAPTGGRSVRGCPLRLPGRPVLCRPRSASASWDTALPRAPGLGTKTRSQAQWPQFGRKRQPPQQGSDRGGQVGGPGGGRGTHVRGWGSVRGSAASLTHS